MPWLIRKRENEFCVYKEGPDGEPTGESLGCHPTQDAAEQQRRALHASEANMTEMRGPFTDVLAITELRGSYPNIPIASDVDYAALIAGDSDPQFLTLPIGMVDAKSANNRYYDEAFVMELMRQTLANKPIGLFGHLSEAERATAFPKEALHWVGAVRDGNTIWGKAYLVGEARERVRRYRASGKTLATSIDAYAEGQWDESLKAYRMDAKSLRLNQIDLAPADRAGIGDLARVPVLTTEMQDGTNVVESEATMPEKGKLDYINEMTAEDARLIPEPVRAAIIAAVPPPPEVAQLTAVREALGLAANADVAATVQEMRRQQEEQAKAAVTARITELATNGDKAVKIEAVRPLVIELVQARQPQTVEDAERIYGEVIATDNVKRLLSAQVREIMGPAQGTAVAGQAKSNSSQWWDDEPVAQNGGGN